MFLKPVSEIRLSDYSLADKDTAMAIEQGLAEATWYASPVPKQKMRTLLERRDGPPIRDTLLWFALIIGSGVFGFMFWGTWWAILPFIVYGVLYASTSAFNKERIRHLVMGSNVLPRNCCGDGAMSKR